MSGYTKREIAVGLFVILGCVALGYLSVSLGGLRVWPADRYQVVARFSSVGPLREGGAVRMAGVQVGRVARIELDGFVAETRLELDRQVELPVDTIASIRTEGLLGESFVHLSPGGAEELIAEGGRIAQTEPALDLVELLGRYAFGSDEAEGGGGPDAHHDADLQRALEGPP